MLELKKHEIPDALFLLPVYHYTTECVSRNLVCYIPSVNQFRLKRRTQTRIALVTIFYCLTLDKMLAVPAWRTGFDTGSDWSDLGFDDTKVIHEFKIKKGYLQKINSRDPTVYELMKLKLGGQIGQ